MKLSADERQMEDLRCIMEEGRTIAEFLTSPAWSIIERTLQAQISNYREDCYDAAKSTNKNISNYLGRMEALEWAINVIKTAFKDAAERASAQFESLTPAREQQKLIDEKVAASVSEPMNQAPGTV